MTRNRKMLVFMVVLCGALIWHASARTGHGGGGVESKCYDATGDGALDISDPVFLLSFLFTGGPAPPPCNAQSGVVARDVTFDPSGSTLTALNVQAALLELDQKVKDLTTANTTLEARVAYLELRQPSLPAIDVVPIPAGSFLMGSPETEAGRATDESLHRVHITKPFFMGTTHITQAQFEGVTGYNPSILGNLPGCPDCPVQVNQWHQVPDFLRRLTEQARTAGKIGPNDVYRLPTEAEWEYACRAGTTTRFSFGDAAECVSDNAFCVVAGDNMWWTGNSSEDGGPHPVAKKLPNPWGLYDMHGNYYEVCSDWYGPYPVGELSDPIGAASGPGHVMRGGSYFRGLSLCRSASRLYVPVESGGYGLRVVLQVAP